MHRKVWILAAAAVVLLTACSTVIKFDGMDLSAAFPAAERIEQVQNAVSAAGNPIELVQIVYAANDTAAAETEIPAFLETMNTANSNLLTHGTWGEDWQQYAPTEHGKICQQLIWVTEDALIQATILRNENTENKVVLQLTRQNGNLKCVSAQVSGRERNHLYVVGLTENPTQEYKIRWDCADGRSMTMDELGDLSPGDTVMLWLDCDSERNDLNLEQQILFVKKLCPATDLETAS